MPRAAWLAQGALAAAVATQAGPLAAPGAPAVLVAAAVALGLGAACHARWPGRPAAGWVALGAAALLARVALGSLLAVPATVTTVPAGAVVWTASVRSVSAPSGVTQPAVIDATPAGATTAVRLWAALPRYPEVVPGDRIRFTARVAPPPADDAGFAAYLAGIGAAGPDGWRRCCRSRKPAWRPACRWACGISCPAMWRPTSPPRA